MGVNGKGQHLTWHIPLVIRAHHDWPSQMHENLLISTSDSECFDAANQQMSVHLWGPCVMGVYYIMIIIEISKKRVLIDRIYHFRRCQIMRWWH